jgi:hypothetical protein
MFYCVFRFIFIYLNIDKKTMRQKENKSNQNAANTSTTSQPQQLNCCNDRGPKLFFFRAENGRRTSSAFGS